MSILRMMMFCLSCISLVISVSLHAMEELPLPEKNRIILHIMPEKKYSLTDDNADSGGNIMATLCGFCYEGNTIELRDSDDACDTTAGLVYTPETLAQALKTKEEKEYPLDWHKKVSYIKDNMQLILLTTYDDGRQERINMPKATRKRLLDYLLYDTTQDRGDCFHLCKKVVLERAEQNEEVNTEESLMNYIDFIPDTEFFPGDMVGLFVSASSDEDSYSCWLQFKHFMIALGDNTYLSKAGPAGVLHISDLQSAKNSWECLGCVKVDSAIGKRKDFLYKAFCPIAYRNILMYIFPNEKSFANLTQKVINCFPTLLAGFRHDENQVELRSDILLSGSIDSIPFNTTEELYDHLLNGRLKAYTLSGHRKILLVGDEVLSMFLYKNGEFVPIHFPFYMIIRLLRYLECDSQDYYTDSFDFCKKLCLDKYSKDELLHKTVSYDSQWNHIDEDKLMPGDTIALGLANAIRHFAIALGNGLYLSKFGNGGFFSVTDMDSMMKYALCKGFVLIEPTITRYQKFLKEIFFNREKTSINFRS